MKELYSVAYLHDRSSAVYLAEPNHIVIMDRGPFNEICWIRLFNECEAISRNTTWDIKSLFDFLNGPKDTLGKLKGECLFIVRDEFNIRSFHVTYNTLKEALDEEQPTPPVFSVLYDIERGDFVLEQRQTANFELVSVIVFPNGEYADFEGRDFSNRVISKQQFTTLLGKLKDGTIKPYIKIDADDGRISLQEFHDKRARKAD